MITYLMVDQITPYKKIRLVYSTIKKPYKIIFNKLLKNKGVDLLYSTRNGISFHCRSGTTDINEAIVILSGTEYPEKIIKGLKNPKPIIVDAGAHLGFFSLFVKKLKPYSRIIAIEPLPENLRLLKVNLKLNSIRDVVIVKKALLDNDKRLKLYLPNYVDYDAASTLTYKNTPVKIYSIQSISLSKLIKLYNLEKIDLLKMDIEGAEFQIIINDIKLLKKKILYLIFEYHENIKSYNKSTVKKILQDNGFKKVHEFRHVLCFKNTQIN
jgi:FkbM family methyltransferase